MVIAVHRSSTGMIPRAEGKFQASKVALELLKWGVRWGSAEVE
jgi:hypothetical protein